MKPGEHRSRKRRSRRGKKSHSRVTLSQEDVEFLKDNTKFDEQEIREWFKGFKVSVISPHFYAPWNLRI